MYRQKTKEFKLDIIKLHLEGYGASLISRQLGTSTSSITLVISRYRRYGLRGLDRLPFMRYSTKFKQQMVRIVLEKSLSCPQVALQHQVSPSVLYSWVRKVRAHGYEELAHQKRIGRPPTDMGRPKKREPETELEKLIEENLRLKAEVALLKKVKALVDARYARQQKIGCKPSND